jgi:hypothetical protein
LQKATHQNHKKDGAEKLDILQWLAKDVKTSIEYHLKMHLKEDELFKFLETEGMAPSDKNDIWQAIDNLWKLRKREMDRHVPDSGRGKKVDSEHEHFQEFRIVLYSMPEKEVRECFEPQDPSKSVRLQTSAVEQGDLSLKAMPQNHMKDGAPIFHSRLRSRSRSPQTPPKEFQNREKDGDEKVDLHEAAFRNHNEDAGENGDLQNAAHQNHKKEKSS